MTLSELFTKHRSDKNTTHTYGPVYDSILEPLKDKVTAVLELGVQSGASLRAWRDFFPSAVVVGIDINLTVKSEDRVEVFQADATKKEDIDRVLGDRKFDVIIDDASHWEEHQITSFKILLPRLIPGGLYFIEDVQHYSTCVKLMDMGFQVECMADKGGFDNNLAFFKNLAFFVKKE